MRNVAISFVGAMALAATAAAQTVPAASHSLRGSVYDSIGRRPLAGAVVQAVAVDDPRARAFTATTDSGGHYRITGLPVGRFAVGFQHDALNALGLDSPIRAVELSRDTSVMLDLATPSGATVSASACGPRDVNHRGFLGGYVQDARTMAPLAQATILAQWVELDLRGGKLQSAPHRAMATIGDDGVYRLCGIPTDGSMSLRVSSKDTHVIDAELTLPAGGADRRDFHLADASQKRGDAAIVIHLIDAGGSPLPSGQAAIPELGVEAPVERGDAVVSGIPAGTWLVTVRTLGYEPRQMLRDATRDREAETITMTRLDPVLDTVRVSAKVRRDSEVVRAIEQRLLSSTGTLVRADNISAVNATEAGDAIRAAAGFVMKGRLTVEARAYGMTGAPCVTRPSANTINYGISSSNGSGKAVVIYLNGQRVPEGIEAIDRMITVKDLLAVEAYPDVTTAPFLWRTNDACAVILFWTRH